MDFNPRAPCGARRFGYTPKSRQSIFQSTRPVWGATPVLIGTKQGEGFQSTRPVWGATESLFFADVVDIISIHAPRVGRDGKDGNVH